MVVPSYFIALCVFVSSPFFGSTKMRQMVNGIVLDFCIWPAFFIPFWNFGSEDFRGSTSGSNGPIYIEKLKLSS